MTPTYVQCCGICNINSPYENGYCSGLASTTASPTTTCASEGTLCYDGENTADFTNVECCGSCELSSNPYENVYCSGLASTTASPTTTCASEGTLCWDPMTGSSVVECCGMCNFNTPMEPGYCKATNPTPVFG